MISLVMTTYNGLKYISEQLDSIRTQTLLPDEVLIYDDRSTDGTYEYVQKYIDKYDLHTWNVYKNKENKGYSLNFSDAIEAAKGDLIFLCDQDDIWHADKIEKMSAVMQKNKQIALLASNVHPFYMGKNPQKVYYKKLKGDLIKINRRGSWIKPLRPGCTMCFRKELMEHYHEIWFAKYPHDCLLWGLSVLQGRAYLYNHDTIEFRRHDTNASSRGGQSIDYRICGIENEIQIITKVKSALGINDQNLYNFLAKQEMVYRYRKEILLKGALLKSVLMLRYLRYYGQTRFWMTDIFYIIKRKKEKSNG